MPQRRGRIDWAYHIARQRKSGLPVQEYCHKAGFSSWSFYRNREKIERSTRVLSSTPKPHDGKSLLPFLHIGTLPVHGSMRIYFPDGTRVECDGSLGKENLSSLVSALKDAAGGGRQC